MNPVRGLARDKVASPKDLGGATSNGMKKLKINFSLPLVIILAVGLLLVGINQAEATTVTYAQNTTWDAGVGNITVEANSNANEVVTTGTTMTITIASGQKMVLTSAAGLYLLNDGGYTFVCDGTGSHLTITSSTTKNVIVTPSSTSCSTTGGSSSGGTSTPTPTPTPAGGGGTTPAATPTPTSTPAAATPTPTPVVSVSKPTPASKGFVSLAAVKLKDGDVVSASGSSDPDVYIVNPHGYKRLFLNPAIFGFYGHLGGFSKVKSTTSVTRDTFVTSGLFRNCETNGPKVYGVEVTGEDTGMLHWVNTTGAQAVKDDPDFFKKVFCINTNEFNWYKKGTDYTSVNQIPDYARGSVSSSTSTPTPTPTPAPVSTAKKYKVVSDVGYLNVRSSASTSSSILGQLNAGTVIESLSKSGVWHKIKYQNKDAWVHGDYLQAM